VIALLRCVLQWAVVEVLSAISRSKAVTKYLLVVLDGVWCQFRKF